MKPIEETHPSITAYDKEVRPIYSDENRIVPVIMVQKHTVDKQVLREKIIKIEESYKDYKGATRLAGRLLRELSLEAGE